MTAGLLHRRRGPIAIAAILAALGMCGALSVGAPPSPSRVVALAAPAALRCVPEYRGATSCAAAACHGAIAPRADGKGILGNEHTTWLTKDAHSRAYESLRSSRSAAIIRKLGRTVPAWLDPDCLACHSTPGASSQAERSEGIGCESCHGKAGCWLGPHTTFDWAATPPDVKSSSFGMTALTRPVDRAESCVGCHVGEPAKGDAPKREVNHDLLAAGHPRLNFEFTAYMANMPPHWSEKGTNKAADFPARAWILGRIVTARAALDLLEARAADPKSPWPELSEYSCWSCHHSLRDETWRRDRTDPEQPAGSPHWGTWFAPSLRLLARTEATPRIDLALRELRAAMSRPYPNRDAVRQRAEDASKALDDWLPSGPENHLTPDRIARLIAAFNARDEQGRLREARDWDGATAIYLGLVPLKQALEALDPARVDPRLRTDIEELLRRLEFPPEADGPKPGDPTETRPPLNAGTAPAPGNPPARP